MLKRAMNRIIRPRFGNFFYLLLSLLIYLLSFPFLKPFGLGKAITVVFFSSVFLSSICVISRNKRWYYLVIVFAVLAIVLRILASIHSVDSKVVELGGAMVNVTCFSIIAVAIIKYILNDKIIALNEIYGAICAYLLIGLIWAFLYNALMITNPASFHFPPELDSGRMALHLIYFSFITLTSTGFGDIYPIAPFAEVLSYIEAIIGQIYVVVLIGWMVGTLATKNRK